MLGTLDMHLCAEYIRDILRMIQAQGPQIPFTDGSRASLTWKVYTSIGHFGKHLELGRYQAEAQNGLQSGQRQLPAPMSHTVT